MSRLDGISVPELQQTLDSVEGKKPAQRLIAAIAHKNGVSQTELADWFGVQRRTVYGWFTRLEAEPLEDAVHDEQRTGRPRKLTTEQQTELRKTLHNPPTAVGYERSSWTPALVQQYLEATFEVTYSRPSCRRLMKGAGLQYRRSPPPAGDSSSESDDSETGRWLPT